jgi:hypothetical protein
MFTGYGGNVKFRFAGYDYAVGRERFARFYRDYIILLNIFRFDLYISIAPFYNHGFRGKVK